MTRSLWLAGVLSLATSAALADAGEERGEPTEVEPYARVIVETTALRSGPGTGFRRVLVASRGDVFPITKRATRGYWFQVELPDGTHGWVFGDAVYVLEVGPEEASGGRLFPKLFAPPPLPDAHMELAAMFGALGGGGFMAFRPSVLLAPTFGFELNAAAVVARGGRILIAGAGGILNLFPNAEVVPFMTVGGGAAVSAPNADSFLLESGTTGVMYAGGGLRFGFRYRLTLRVEARAYAFFDANRYRTQEEYSGGLTVFF